MNEQRELHFEWDAAKARSNEGKHGVSLKPEYDFSRAERGKHFAGANAVFHIPVYLDQEVQAFLMEKAAGKGVGLDRLVNDLLKHDIEAFHTLG